MGDVLLTIVAWAGALLLRHDGDVSRTQWTGLIGFLPVVGLVLFALIVQAISLLIDLAHGVLDPRIREGAH